MDAINVGLLHNSSDKCMNEYKDYNFISVSHLLHPSFLSADNPIPFEPTIPFCQKIHQIQDARVDRGTPAVAGVHHPSLVPERGGAAAAAHRCKFQQLFFWRVKEFGGKFHILCFQICSFFQQICVLLSMLSSSITDMAGMVAGEEEEKPRGKRRRRGREASDLAPVTSRCGLREKKLRKVGGDPGRGTGKRPREVVVEENFGGRSKRVGFLLVFVLGFCCLIVCWQ